MNTRLLRTHPGFGVISIPGISNETLPDNLKRASVECYLRHRRDRKVKNPNAVYWLERSRFYAAQIS